MNLTYDSAYHLHCQLGLRSGRAITLEALHQEMTYAGLLVGTPDAESNDRQITHALKKAQTFCVAGAKPTLIAPPRRDYLREPGDMTPVRTYTHRISEWLPMVTCIGSFKDVRTVRNPSMDLSVLTVVWFQDEYALPIREPALSRLVDLDWDSFATDVEI
jgi:hypothetical protein